MLLHGGCLVDKYEYQVITMRVAGLVPPINVDKVKLSACQRVLMVDYDSNTEKLSLRHYLISAQPAGVSKRYA